MNQNSRFRGTHISMPDQQLEIIRNDQVYRKPIHKKIILNSLTTNNDLEIR